MPSRRFRYAAPVVVTGLIAAGAWLPTLKAAATPDLPAISAQHLVEKVLGEKVTRVSGTFAWDADLGLPSLGDLTGGGGQDPSTSSGFQPTSLLSGDHTFEVWVDGPAEQRIAAPGTLEETDLVRNGGQAWVYDSATNHVTHYVGRPTRRAGAGGVAMGEGAAPGSFGTRLTPAAVADQLLAGVRTLGTDISVSRPVEVAGRPAYVLRLAPDRAVAANRVSTVSYATIAVDARTGFPLRTSIYAVGQGAPALQVGFSSISYATPAASEFVAPEGQSTTTKVVGATRKSVAAVGGAGSGGSITTGELNALRAREAHRTGSQVTSSVATTPGESSNVNVRWAQGPVSLPAVVPTPTTLTGGGAVGVLGDTSAAPHPVWTAHDWGSVRTLQAGSTSRAEQHELDSLSTAVSGRWGSGRLVTSTLVNALVLGNGDVLIGAVTPAALEAAAAQTSH